MHDTIFVSRWGPATRPLTRLILPPSFERPAPAAGASIDVDALLPNRPRLMRERIRANARRTAGGAAATGLEVLSPVELIAGGALELLRGAAVPA
jgi:hypothetical protein